MITLHGLAQCDTCRKARAWLDGQGIAYRFNDYRDRPVGADDLAGYARQIGWPRLVNRASTTWRSLPDEDRTPQDDAQWLALVARHPTLIRRPLLVMADGAAMSGFSAEGYAQAFGR